MFFYKLSVSLSDVTAHITPTSVTSPVSTAAKVTDSTAMTSISVETDVAFPAVLKGSQKQRVPPPVPPRGSPKAKRGGGTSQSSIETKGDYQNINISVTDIPSQTPITSSDDDFCFYGHDLKLQEPAACYLSHSTSDLSVKVTKLVTSNNLLGFIEEGHSITERPHHDNDWNAQTSMISMFNLDKIVREHLDSGDYNDTSFTESSSEEKIVNHDLIKEIELVKKHFNGKSSINTTELLENVATSITDKLPTSTNMKSSSEKFSLHNIKSSDLINAAKTLKKISIADKKLITNPKIVHMDLKDQQKEIRVDKIDETLNKNMKKPNINVSKKDNIQEKKLKPKIEIRTYTEGRSKGGMTKDQVICHKKAKTKIDMFQKKILKVQSDSENSSRRSSISSSQSFRKSNEAIKHLTKETKTACVHTDCTIDNTITVGKKPLCIPSTVTKSIDNESFSGSVHEKIKQFTESIIIISPTKIPRQKKKNSFKRKTDKRKVYIMKKDVEEAL